MELNEANFTAAIAAAVDKRGKSWVYPINETGWALSSDEFGGGCRYFLDSGGPACLIGTALAELGYTSNDLACLEGENAGHVLYELTGEDGRSFIPYSDAAPSWVRGAYIAQAAQDDGFPWGDALDRYLRKVSGN